MCPHALLSQVQLILLTKLLVYFLNLPILVMVRHLACCHKAYHLNFNQTKLGQLTNKLVQEKESPGMHA